MEKVEGSWRQGANLSKMHLVSYNSYAYNGIQQYRIVKGKMALPKCLLCCHSNWKRSTHFNRTVGTLVFVKIGLY